MGHNTQPQQPVQVISNEVFLKSIFGSRFNTVHTTSFKPDPLNVKRMAWTGYPYYIQAESDARSTTALPPPQGIIRTVPPGRGR